MESEYYRDELNDLQKIKSELARKRNSLRLQAVSISDANSLHTAQTQIDDLNKKIEAIEVEIINLGNKTGILHVPLRKINDAPLHNEAFENDVIKAIEVLRQETKSLNYNSTKEDIAKIHNLKSKLYNEIFKELDNQLSFVVTKQDLMYSSVLFDKIYGSEEIDSVTEQAIQEIRSNNEKFKWYDRGVIASALSLSLINYKFSSKKANILLDLISDAESKVWERALTGLIISIICQKNRSWLRYTHFVNRLKILKTNNDIQEGIKLIDFILKHELYKINLSGPGIYKMDFFNNPMHYFIPFYDNNEILLSALDNLDSEFDISSFHSVMLKSSIMDSFKFALCIAISSKELSGKDFKEVIPAKDKVKIIFENLLMSENFKPFHSLISEYYCFFNYFPDKLRDDVFNQQMLLTKTDLKEHVLNKITRLLLEANTFYRDKQYREAIRKYQDLLKINSSHVEARWQLGNSWIAMENIEKGKGYARSALNMFLGLEKEYGDKVDEKTLGKIAICYHEMKEYKNSNEYCEKVERNTDGKVDSNILCLRSDNYRKLDDSSSAHMYCQKAESNALDNDSMYNVALAYNSNENYEDALRVCNKLVNLQPETSKYWYLLGDIYSDLFEWSLSISALKKAHELDKNRISILMDLARSYMFSELNLPEAKIILENLSKHKSDIRSLIYGNLGHLYLIEGDHDKAFKYYLKCVEGLINKEDFLTRMDRDIKYIIKTGVSQTDYKKISEEVVKSYEDTKKK